MSAAQKYTESERPVRLCLAAAQRAMFKRFSAEASVSGRAPVKTSVNRAIRKQLQQNYPSLGDELELLLPKKKPVFIIKAADHTQLVECRGLALFFSLRDEEVYIPTLTTVHKCAFRVREPSGAGDVVRFLTARTDPDMMPQVQVDYGAIPYVMHGAQIMCRGLTSKGGKLPDGLKKVGALARWRAPSALTSACVGVCVPACACACAGAARDCHGRGQGARTRCRAADHVLGGDPRQERRHWRGEHPLPRRRTLAIPHRAAQARRRAR